MSRLRKVLLFAVPAVGLIALAAILGVRARRIPEHADPIPTYFPGAILLSHKAERYVDVGGLPTGLRVEASYRINQTRHSAVVAFNKRCQEYHLEKGNSGWSGKNSTGGDIGIGVTEREGQTFVFYREFYIGENDWWAVLQHKLDVIWSDNTN